ncbi:MAG TPA: hypothetical protein VF920_09440 [Dongiaceae bacterium]
MQELSRLGTMILISVFGVLGLAEAAHGNHHVLPYWGGVGMFIVCVLLMFKLIAENGKHAH